MRKIIQLFLFTFFLFQVSNISSIAFAAEKFKAGEVLVKFKPASNYIALQNVSRPMTKNVSSFNEKFKIVKMSSILGDFQNAQQLRPQLQSIEKNPFDDVYVVSLESDADVEKIAEEMNADPSIEYAEPNYAFELFDAPNDPGYSKQWGLPKIEAKAAWETTKGTSSIVVAILDSGVDYTHPDLKENIWVNSGEIPGNKIDDDHNGYIDDVNGWDSLWETSNVIDQIGHGTHVSGIVGASANNSIGVTGVCPQCKLMPIKVIDYTSYVDALIKGINYAVKNHAKVINMSLGLGLYSKTFEDAVNYAHSEGLVVVCAAGNASSSSRNYPAAFKSAFAVAATDWDDSRAVFTSYGTWVDVSAPGVSIYSTMPTYASNRSRSGYPKSYAYLSGTSMASPCVAGLAGLMFSKYPSMSSSEVESAILQGSDKSSFKGIGVGRVNAKNSLLLKKGNDIPFSLYSVSPSSCSVWGGTELTIKGENFSPKMKVKIGPDYIEQVTVVDSSTIKVTTTRQAVGPADISVANEQGAILTLVNKFEITSDWEAPVVESISASSGSINGGTEILVKGKLFKPGLEVWVWGYKAQSATFIDSETIKVVTGPCRFVGYYPIYVKNLDGQFNINAPYFLYVAPAPKIISISPNYAPRSGGTKVVIKGENFRPDAYFTIGIREAFNIIVVDSTTITGIIPPDAGDIGDVTVINTDSSKEKLSFGFHYISDDILPSIFSIQPSSGPIYGGTEITILGENLPTVGKVYLGDKLLENTVFESSNKIKIITSSVTLAKQYDLTIVDGYYQFQIIQPMAFEYLYEPLKIESISPLTGSMSLDTKITIKGEHFLPQTVVMISGRPILFSEFIDSSTISGIAPRLPEGQYNVSVMNLDNKKVYLPKTYSVIAKPGKIQFSASMVSVSEAKSSIDVQVDRIDGNDGDISIQYGAVNESAVMGKDFEPTPQSSPSPSPTPVGLNILNFKNGEVKKYIKVNILDDKEIEFPETFKIVLRDISGGSFLGAISSMTVLIANDDLPFLNVANGDGTGFYLVGATATIYANTPTPGQTFDKWIGDKVSQSSSAITTILIGTTSVSVSATYKELINIVQNPNPNYPGSPSPNELAGRFVNVSNQSVNIFIPSGFFEPVDLSIVDLRGNYVRKLLSDESVTQSRTVTWDGHNESGEQVSSDVYLVLLKSGHQIHKSKICIVR